MSYWVLYEDDYADNGGVGWRGFFSEGEALDFIAGRLAQLSGTGKPKVVDNYVLIRGVRLEIEAYHRVLDVRVKD